ncbi:MAG: hypothetical protein NTV29_11090 [Planctomycetota bacterium]|jgi:hypothetical protein|nr:hypothetical protein [Planctomycetota bacterium]
MTRLLGLSLLFACVVHPVTAVEIQPPVQPDEAKIIAKIIALEGHSVDSRSTERISTKL